MNYHINEIYRKNQYYKYLKWLLFNVKIVINNLFRFWYNFEDIRYDLNTTSVGYNLKWASFINMFQL